MMQDKDKIPRLAHGLERVVSSELRMQIFCEWLIGRLGRSTTLLRCTRFAA